jgi:hypothetical protein
MGRAALYTSRLKNWGFVKKTLKILVLTHGLAFGQ